MTNSTQLKQNKSLPLQLWQPSTGIVPVYNEEYAHNPPAIGLLAIFEAAVSIGNFISEALPAFRAVAIPVTNAISNVMYGKDFDGTAFQSGNYLGNAWRYTLGFSPDTDFPIPARLFKNSRERLDFYNDWAEHYFRCWELGNIDSSPQTVTLASADIINPLPSTAPTINITFTPTPAAGFMPITVIPSNGAIVTTEDQGGGAGNNVCVGINILGINNVPSNLPPQ